MHDPDTRHEWVSVKQAAIHLGTSESDVRRRIRRGELESESIARPGGTLLRVRLPTPDTHQHTESAGAPESRQQEPDTRPDIASGLLERLTAQDDTIAAKDAEIARLNAQALTLAERAARAEGEAESSREALEWTQAQLERERGEVERLRARRWWDPRTW